MTISFFKCLSKACLITHVQTGEKHSHLYSLQQWYMCGLYLPILAVIHGNYGILDGLAFNLESQCC